MKKKIIVAKKNPAPSAPKPWHHPDNFDGKPHYWECQTFLERKGSMSDFEVNGLWRDLCKRQTDLADKPRWMRELGVEYALQMQGYQRAKGEVPDLIARRFKMAIDFDAAALRKESEFYDSRYHKGGSDIMATKEKGSKKERRSGDDRRGKRVTAASVLIPLLSAAKVKTDDEIIEIVKEETGSTKFDKAQLAWYKWKFREGKLKGMDGKKHVINQGSPLKKKAQQKAEKAAAKKKVVVKKKAKSEEPVEIPE